ncbi:hypothetical protein PPSIR1_31368 [Plesiocystis pacifica SIR-1]|uniref:Uncharacterized protein n=1 Tax=Plesiocystis pacifica SIR-1 TaxID=391625 RepID=A6GDD6_9BACT|nr:hypothetical protein [Plesiocystis pacifica]EDM76127.1 hypothetical protein PPSIR1_31368 [Plesiocystis pacifica SIR-1]
MPFVAFLGLALLGPPELPPDIGGPPSDAPAEESPSETPDAAPEEAPPANEAPGDAGEDPGAAGDDEAIAVTPADETGEAPETDDAAAGAAAGGAAAGGAAAGGAAAGGAAAGGGGGAGAGAGGSGTSGAASGGAGASGSGGGSSPAVQRPGAAPAAQPTQPAQPAQPQGPSASPPVQPTQPTQPSTPEGPQPAPESKTELESPKTDETDEKGEKKDEDESYKKLGGFRLFRIGLAPKIGYTHGTSQKDGLFDRDKSIEDSINNGEVTMSGAGDLGQTNFGGPQWGFILDAEVVGINVWLDFHKFFRPGGMWSLLLGYDHEFGFGRRLRLDVGFGGGLNNVFLGDALQDLYYDEDNPESINIATLGVEGRVSADLHIKIAGPLYTGPGLMLGYHYLWSANAAEVTVEKGLHYSAAWSLRLDFAAPKLIGGRKKK